MDSNHRRRFTVSNLRRVRNDNCVKKLGGANTLYFQPLPTNLTRLQMRLTPYSLLLRGLTELTLHEVILYPQHRHVFFKIGFLVC